MGTNMCAYILLSPCGCDNLYSIFVQLIWCLSASSGGIFCFGREFHLVHGSSAWRSRLGAMGLTGTDAWNFLWSVLKSIWAKFFWYSGYIVLDLKASSCDSFLCLIILKVYLELFHILWNYFSLQSDLNMWSCIAELSSLRQSWSWWYFEILLVYWCWE